MKGFWQRSGDTFSYGAGDDCSSSMAPSRLSLLVLGIALFLTAFAAGGGAAAPNRDKVRPAASRFRSDRVLVAFHHGTSVEGRLQVASRNGLSVAAEGRSPHFAVLRLSPQARSAGQTVQKALAALRSDPRVRVAEPDFELHTTALPSDPFFPDLYGLHNTGQQQGLEDADIDAPEAWELTTGNKSIIVAVIDTGVDYRHPDLDFNILRDSQQRVVGYDFVNDDGDPMDDYGHGTHVAGTIGARANNGMGVVGVSHVVRIMPVKFLGADGFGTTAAAIQAIDFAVNNGAKILNNSWGGGERSQLLFEAIQRARSQGVLFVASAGNDTADTDEFTMYPASYNREIDNVVSVAASDSLDQLAFFSNYGDRTVDLAAPGLMVLSTTPGNTYSYASGTSMAAPHVSGVAALVLARFPGLSLSQLKARVVNSADLPETLKGLVRRGRLNAVNALADDSSAPAAPGNFRLTHRAQSGLRVSWSAPGDDGLTGQATSYEIRFSTSPIHDGNFGTAAFSTAPPDPGAPGTETTYLLSGLQADTDYFLAVRAYDNVGNASPLAVMGPLRTLPAAADCPLLDGAEGALRFTGDGGWAASSEARWQGSSAYSDSPGALYAHSVNSSLTQTDPVPYSGGVSEAVFYAKSDLEYGADVLYIEVSTDESPQWEPLGQLTGISDWTQHRFTLAGTNVGTARIRFRLQTDESVSGDGVWLDDIQICTPISLCLFEDTVEATPQFEASQLWRATNEDYVSPTHAYSDTPGTLYASGLDISLTQKTPVSVAGILPQLKFLARLDLEQGYDWLAVEVSTDAGENWEFLTAYTGHAGWRVYQHSLARYEGSEILIRFRLFTDSSVSYDGVWLDDIRICGEPLLPSEATAPSAPTNLQAVASGPTRIELSWTGAGQEVAGYKIDRRQGNDAYSYLALVRAPAQSFSDLTVRPGTSYTYRVRATHLSLDSQPSDDATAVTPGAPEVPTAPANLSARLLRTEEIRLTWSDTSTNEEVFLLERRLGDGAFRVIENLPAGSTTFTDGDLAGDASYTYRVRAANAGGASEPSNEIALTTPSRGTISVSTTDLQFGAVKVGRRVRKRLTIRNVGSGTLTGSVGTPFEPFRIVSGGGAFRLTRGQRKTVLIQFAPTSAGNYFDGIGIFCSDRDNPSVRVNLAGSTPP